MELKIQPTPEVEIKPADKGIVSRKEYFREKTFEEINEYFFAGHLVRNWRPKAELVYPPVPDETAVHYECDFNREVQNCFNEDNADEIYLRTPPPCFVVIGKFGSNVTRLSEDIAREYGSVLIQVDEIVKQVIKTDTQTGKFLVKVLRVGVALTLNFVLALLSYVAHSAEARHRGYVLCGLPLSPYLHDLPVEQQLNYIFSWDNKPTVFINVLYEDEDLVRTRGNTKWEIMEVGNRISLSPHDDLSEEEEEEEEEREEVGEGNEEKETDRVFQAEDDMDVSPSRPRIRLPRDEESQVWSELEVFDLKIKAAIDMIRSKLDPQYFITVDSRVKNEFEIVRARLSLLQVWKVPVPVPLCPKRPKTRGLEKKLNFAESEDEGEHERELTDADLEILEVMDLPPQKAIPTLFSKKTISPKYRWELSHYNYVCPVSLREGAVVEGKSEFAVVFMKYIYFLRDKESMTKFIENPRPYALPIRPKPQFRFIIIGYPKCGKTSLANYLSAEFCVPIVDVDTILRNDIVRKKFVYREFCRQKAESREITRLTALAWERWRTEEEQRITLIEQWISYIQSLLNQRIEQFYSAETADVVSDRETQVHSYLPMGTGENSGRETEGSDESGLDAEKILEVRGVSVETERDPYERERTPIQSHTSPSEKIIRAMKHDDYEFNEHGLEVEANLFFSSLWNTFTKEQGRFHPEKALKRENADEERRGEEEEVEDEEESVTVNWCSLLPPQSLSSFLLKKKSYNTRERRKSFRIFLEAASKAYWCPSTLKTEFAKWRLPCFMDIPLCELFLENPLLLFKYCPEWLKERPPFPDPVDSFNPVVSEAGRRAFAKANTVSIHHDSEEKGRLLGHALEKVERDGMRVTGGVLTPGGWVVDSIDLDLCIWQGLAREKVLPDYVYILTDSDPEFKRIINDWWDLHLPIESPTDMSLEKKNISAAESTEDNEKASDVEEGQNVHDVLSELVSKNKSVESRTMSNMVQTLRKCAEYINQGNRDLDGIYSALNNVVQPKGFCISPLSLDPFTSSMVEELADYFSDSGTEDQTGGQLVGKFSNFNFNLVVNRDMENSDPNLPLGDELQFFTQKVFDYFRKRQSAKGASIKEEVSFENVQHFFVNLLSLPLKIQKVREFLTSLNKGDIIRELDVTHKTLPEIFADVKKNIETPFLKKPRELESFEKEELDADFRRESGEPAKNEEEEEGEAEAVVEDLRIFGESGPFCIVNLYKNNLLLGKPEFALRYYGKLYLFWNQEAKDKFIENPEKYAPYYSPIRCLPPIRIFIVGPMGSGKTTLARALASQCSTYYVDYITFLNFKLTPHLKPGCAKFTALESQKLLLSEGFNAEAKEIKAKFMKIPYEKRMFYLENPFNAEDEKQVLEETVSRTPLPSSYPEFTYKCIESIEEDENEPSSESKLILQSSGDLYRSMKEVENTLNDYVQNRADLGEYGMARSLWYLWNTGPFNTEGFILDGFPMRYYDVKHIVKNTWIPDMVIEVLLPEEIAIERNMEEKLEQWDTKLKQEIVEERLLEDTLSTLQKVFMSIRRDRLLYRKPYSSSQRMSSQRSSEIRSEDFGGSRDFGRQKMRKNDLKKMSSRIAVDYWSKVNSEAPSNAEHVDLALNQEFPPLEFNPIFETYEAGKERLTADFVLNYRRDMQEISKFKSELQDLRIPWYEVDGTKNSAKNLVNLYIRMNEIKQRGNLRGEFAFPMEMETAERLLEQGYYFLSKFGRWCPVQMYRSKNPIHMFWPLKERRKIFPVAYRNYIYFIGGKNEMKNFIKDPLKYTFNEPRLPNFPLRIAVIGPPKSGKSTLSSRLGFMFGLRVVTMGTALRFVVEKMRGSTLRKSIIGYLKRGCFLPLSLKVEALMACLNDPACVTQGFVFDGIPFDAAMTQSLAEAGKLPFVILSLVADSYFAKSNREKLDREKYRLPYKQRVDMDSNYRDWDETYKRFVQWNRDTYSNIYELNAKSNVVNVFYEAYDIIRKSFFAILYYVEYCVTDRALPLEYLCVSQHEYELRKSSFHNNCPVCWADLSRLNCLSDPPPRSGLVQYLNHFYWVCPRHLNSFLKTPKNYLPPNVKEFPQILPKVLDRCMFETAPVRIHGLGRCPVTRTDLPNSLEWKGSWDFAVSYAEKVYLCRDQEMMKRFLAQPWKYYLADTEFEANRKSKSTAVEDLGPPKLASLPPIGFLEQTVANLIHNALQVLGSARPVYPNLSPACTGCTFLGLYLKVYNANKRGLLEKECLNFMLRNCKAYQFSAMPFKRTTDDDIDFEPEPSDSNETGSSEVQPINTSDSSVDSFWLDFETQADKMIWSARSLSSKLFKMKIDENDQLKEIPEQPKFNVVLRYQSSVIRVHPLPPIANCITFLYSCKPNLQLPEKFNVNTLYQPITFSSRFAQLIASKVEKTELTKLYEGPVKTHQSEANLWQGKRAVSESTPSEDEAKSADDKSANLTFMLENFIPRFQFLDVMPPVKVPRVPKVKETEPLFFNPHYNYTFTMLMAEFFQVSHVLKCFESPNQCIYQLEYTKLLDRNLGLCPARSQFIFKPKTSLSVHSRRSIDSVQEMVECSPWLCYRDHTDPYKGTGLALVAGKPSLMNFMQTIIFDHLDEVFSHISSNSLSYDSYETQIAVAESDGSLKPVVLFQEILPFPPLSWDIVSRPYYAYRSIPSIFETPQLDHIAHERHVSLLDGIMEPNDHLRFVSYPTWLQEKLLPDGSIASKSKTVLLPRTSSLLRKRQHAVYDFFNFNWTSFLTSHFSSAYSLELMDHTRDEEDAEDAPAAGKEFCEPQSTLH